MKLTALIFFLVSIPIMASDFPKTMPKVCEVKLNSTLEESIGASVSEIITDLKFDWKKTPSKPQATYNECGSSDFYWLVVDKKTCKVLEYEVGDSDGECE